MNVYFKFPRTFHLPFSLGMSSDDKVLASVDHFVGKQIIASEKVDGECTSLYQDHIHARSLDSKHHPSRNLVKALHANIAHEIPKNWRISGENLFAKHSIHYHHLPAYFLVFAIYNDSNMCLSWDDTVEYAAMLGLKTVPVLYNGLWDEEKIRACWTGQSTVSPGDEQEGYVVRLAEAFPYEKHAESTGKLVRKNHVQTSSHWMSEEVVPNQLN